MTYNSTYTFTARNRLLCPIGAIFLATTLAGGAIAQDLSIEILGFSDDIGQAVVEVYGSEKGYRNGVPDRVLTAPIIARFAAVTLSGFEGTYAVRAYHDRNLNGSLETLTPGIALEPMGYSQGAWSETTLPDWVHVSFSSNTEPSVQLIRLRTNVLVAFVQMLAVGLPSLLAVFSGLAALRWLRSSARAAPNTGENSHD